MKTLTISRIISSDISPTRRAFRISREVLPALLLAAAILVATSNVLAQTSTTAKTTTSQKAPAQNSSSNGNSAAKKQANQAKKKAAKDKKQQAKQADLTKKYGMNLSQIQQYQTLQDASQKRIADLNKTPGLSKKDHNKKVKAIKKEFQKSVNNLLTLDQKALAANQHAQNVKQNAQVHKVLKKYRKEHVAIKHDHNISNHSEALAQLDKKYEGELTAIVGKDKAQYLLNHLAKKRNTSKKDAQGNGLSYKDAQKYSNIQKNSRQKQNKLDNTPLTRKDRAEKNSQLDEKYNGQVKTLLGDNKYNQWYSKKNPKFDKKLKKKLGFSDQQLAQYKELMNQQAVATVKIHKSKGTKEDKKARIAQVKANTDLKVKQILTPAQYSKLVAKKDNAQHKAKKASTIKKTPKTKPSATASAKP